MTHPIGIQPGALVCVTGANGFIASHLIGLLLREGYRVRGTVRDPSNIEKTGHLIQMAQEAQATDRLDLVPGDLLVPGSFDQAVAGCDAVIHCAAVVLFAVDDPQRNLVDPSVKGTLNVLQSARRAGTVKRVVHTSSMVAVYSFDKPKGHRFTEEDWNTSSTLDTDPYGLAKVSAERAALDFVAAIPEEERFLLVHLNPGMVWGPPLIKAHAKASPALVRDVISRAQPGVPSLMLSVVDVRDVAQAHLQALRSEDPPARCLILGHNAWMPDLMRDVQAMFPDVRMGTRRLPKFVILLASLFDKKLNTAQLRKLVGRDLPMENGLSRAKYGMTYRPLKQTLRDTAGPMIEHGWARVTRQNPG
ncbi:MAG: NAD-dependent epimerase/dehydratase family protein [Rhodobacterales bacterium]|nr:NAD-dependent epimerase/dehydratase family protein [Rhodobacterales bacterium]